MRARAGFLGGILVLLVGAGVAWLAYQAGLSQTAAAATGTAGAVVVYGGGFGFFHIFGILFGLFILFGLARLFFGILFWRGPRHWGERHGMGAGAWGPGGRGGFGPMGPWANGSGRETWVAEMHRRLHEQDAAPSNQPNQTAGAPGVTDQPNTSNTPKA